MTPFSAQKLLDAARNRPGEWTHNVLGQTLWHKQQQILESIRDHPKTCVRSCHASGKSFTAAQAVLNFLYAHPYTSTVLTTAPTFRQVEDVLWREIRTSHAHARIPLGGTPLQTRFDLEPNWFALGLSTDDPDRFQGYHAPHLLVVIDESSGVPPAIHEAIEGVASTGYVRILELGNPTDPTGHFAGTFKSPFYNKIHISCFDTPNFASFPTLEALRLSTEDERAQAVVHSYLITPQWVYERLEEWGESSPMFQARCLGEFPVEGEDTVIALRYALQAINRATDAASTVEVLGVDIARFGSDKTVLAYRKGDNIEYLQRFAKDDLMTTASRIYQFHQLHPYAAIHVDDAGIGGGVTDRLRELNVPVRGINVGQAARKPDLFVNLRSELTWLLRERFEQGLISIPDDDGLVSELTSIKYKFQHGKIAIESKDEMKKRGLHSPDSADAVMLAFADAATSGWAEFYKTQGVPA